MHRYRCQLCGITSRSYATRLGAERHGHGHRERRHGGDHPDGEHILTAGYRGPQGREWTAVVLTFALIAVALVAKLV
ncbi:hypothetical protein ABZ820_12680 [Streptomyces diacarni]|uniref:hypothetical protein n=1 Tax=Streptomyces diacarni TaxID=2800381 RepID=UPI0033FCE7AA